MKGVFQFLVALALAFLLMMAFRALAFTICTVDGEGLEPEFEAGDRVLVNRWSYGLRTGARGGLFPYGRLLRQPVGRGDIVAYEDPTDTTHIRVLLGRCLALPGDTVRYQGRSELVPSLKDCADADYYWIGALGKNNPTDSRQLGFVSERLIIGRAVSVVFNHNPQASLWEGWQTGRFFLPK